MLRHPTIQQLLDRIAELERVIGMDESLARRVQRSAGTTPMESRMLAMIFTREEVSRECLHVALYGLRPEDQQPEMKTLDTLLCKVRTALRQYDIEIETVVGVGWRMTLHNKKLLRELLDQVDVIEIPPSRLPSRRAASRAQGI
jgi:hypothetical protein